MADSSTGSSTGSPSGHPSNSHLSESDPLRSQLEPELGGVLRFGGDRTGLEPELGGVLRQQNVYVDEQTCIGCRHCSHVARNTFFIEPDYGRARVIRQDGDPEDLVQEAIDTCPVDCIHWVNVKELKHLEEERKYQVITNLGLPLDTAAIAAMQRRKRKARKKA